MTAAATARRRRPRISEAAAEEAGVEPCDNTHGSLKWQLGMDLKGAVTVKFGEVPVGRDATSEAGDNAEEAALSVDVV